MTNLVFRFAFLLIVASLTACGGGGSGSALNSGGGSGGGGSGGGETNTPPEARNDGDFKVLQNSSQNPLDVLANDSDAESAISFVDTFPIASTRGGSVVLNDRGTPSNPADDLLNYTPPADTNSEPEAPNPSRRPDTFEYTITDGEDTATATVTIDIAPLACLDRDTQLSAGKGYCFRTYFCSTADPDVGPTGSKSPNANTGCTNDTTRIWMTVHVPHPDKLNASKPVSDTTGFMPLIIHGHGFGGSKSEDFSFPQHFVAEQASGLAWDNGYFAISVTQRGFGEGDGMERSGGRIGIMDPAKEGVDLNQLVDWAIKHLRGNSDNSPIDLDGLNGAADSIYNQVTAANIGDADALAIMFGTATTPAAADARPTLLMNDNQDRLIGAEDAPCALAANAAPGPTDIPAECDPAIGTTGYSYGGGFQYTLARSAGSLGRYGGERLDAMVPHGTWFDLRQSLVANEIPKTVWLNLLTSFSGPPPVGGGNGEDLPDAMTQGRAQEGAFNRIYAPLSNNPFRTNTPADYCDSLTGIQTTDSLGRPVHSTADVFHVQGYRDTLFNFNEGLENVLCYKRALNVNGRPSRDARLLIGVGGHPLPELSAVNYTGRSTSMDIDEVVHCGNDGTGKPRRIVLKQAMQDWFDEKLRGISGAADYIPQVCVVQRNTDASDELVDPNYTNDNGAGANIGERHRYPKEGSVFAALDDVLIGASSPSAVHQPAYTCDTPVTGGPDHRCEIPATAIEFSNSPQPNPDFIPLYTVPGVAGDDSPVLAGIPTLTLQVTGVSPPAVEPLFFVGLGFRRAGRSDELIHDQLTPVRGTSFPFTSEPTTSIGVGGSGARENDQPGATEAGTLVVYGCETNSVQESGACDRGRMVGVGERLLPGDIVGLMVWGGHEQYSANNARNPGQATISGDIELPLLAPTPLPVSVNP